MGEFTGARDYLKPWIGNGYEELDLDGGDLRLDLNKNLVELSQKFDIVFNLGTIEHVWNVHNAWANALRATEVHEGHVRTGRQQLHDGRGLERVL